MGLLQLLFSFKGRLNRQGFWIGIGFNFAFLFIVVNFLLKSTAFELMTLFPLGISLYSVLAIAVKRLHDRNRSGKHALILVVPIVCHWVSKAADENSAWLLGLLMPMLICTIIFLEWGFFSSFPKANQYGEQGLSWQLKQ